MTDQSEHSVDVAQSANAFQVTDSMLLSLRKTKPWVRFLSLTGFIMVFLMVVFGGGSMFFLSKFSQTTPVFARIFMGLFYILFGLLYFIPSLASSIARLNDGGGTAAMEKALANQKSFWKFVGIMFLISSILAIIGIAAAIVIPLFLAR